MKAKKQKKKEERQLTPEHLEWLIRNRSETQKVSARLYRLISENPREIERLGIPVPTLVSISFSLWRSVFYSDKTGLARDTHKGAIGLLSEMLENNAIAYSHEWRSRDWTFNYYAQNARLRLMEVGRREPNFHLPSLPAASQAAPKRRWEMMQSAFDAAVLYFEQRITAFKSTLRSPKARKKKRPTRKKIKGVGIRRKIKAKRTSKRRK